MTSPLASADPSSLEELFSKDPLDLQSQDLDRIIETLRAQRAKFLAMPEKAPAKRTAKAPLAKAELGGKSPEDFLKELGL